jgi:hypothetical protein
MKPHLTAMKILSLNSSQNLQTRQFLNKMVWLSWLELLGICPFDKLTFFSHIPHPPWVG